MNRILWIAPENLEMKVFAAISETWCVKFVALQAVREDLWIVLLRTSRLTEESTLKPVIPTELM